MAEDNNTTTDNSDYEEICYLCRRPESKGRKDDPYSEQYLHLPGLHAEDL